MLHKEYVLYARENNEKKLTTPQSTESLYNNFNPRSLGGGVKLTPPLDFSGFRFLLLNRLSKALAQLFLVCEHIF